MGLLDPGRLATLQKQPEKVIYVNYYDKIDDVKVRAIMAGLADILTREKPDVIYCLFSSGGGLVEAGITLYNFLRSLPVKFIMHNTGSIDSIANIVFLAADTRYTSVHSSFLFHGLIWPFPANTNLNRGQLTEIISSMGVSESKISGIITQRTRLTTEEIGALFAQGESKDAKFALGKGIVTEIKDPAVPTGANLLSFNLT